jgi:hypothetical protein
MILQSAHVSACCSPGAGTDVSRHFHVVPFHRTIRMLEVLPLLLVPTAQALVAEVAATPERLASVPGLGLGTCFQAVPFHRSIRVFTEKLAPLTA